MIKFLVMDVDGTLTDGKIYMGVDGEAFKAFDIKDGYALHTLLKEHGIIPVIITARKSPMVEHRCKELGVTEIHQGVMNKLGCLKGILEKYSSADQQYNLSNVAYIGDDLLDLQCMKPIKEAGGIAGYMQGPVQIEDCTFKGNIASLLVFLKCGSFSSKISNFLNIISLPRNIITYFF